MVSLDSFSDSERVKTYRELDSNPFPVTNPDNTIPIFMKSIRSRFMS